MNAEIPSLISSMVCLCFSAACQRVTPLSKNANEISNIQNASKMYVTIHVFFVFVCIFFASFICISFSVVNFVALGLETS